ncbi:MAG: hypothetical protein H0Z33_09900 [Bacillaceae bacterium]|nr:hypothetical protein [Bacillaceae bacterium]
MTEHRVFIHLPFQSPIPEEQIDVDEKWIRKKIGRVMRFPVQSLTNQTDQRFQALVTFEQEWEDIVKDELTLYPLLPDHIQFVPHQQIEQIPVQFQHHTPYYLFIRLDEQILLHKSVVAQLLKYQPRDPNEVLMYEKGYLYDARKMRMAKVQSAAAPFYIRVLFAEDQLKKVFDSQPDEERAFRTSLPGRYFTRVSYRGNDPWIKQVPCEDRINPSRVMTKLERFVGPQDFRDIQVRKTDKKVETVVNPTCFPEVGNGRQGVVYRISPRKCVKIYDSRKQAMKEIKSYIMAQGSSITPKIHEFGSRYMLMEYLDGKNLNKYLREKGKISRSMTRKILKLLKKMKKSGFVDRDPRLRHIFITRRGKLKVIDLVNVYKRKRKYPIRMIKDLSKIGLDRAFLKKVRKLEPDTYKRWKKELKKQTSSKK